MWKPETHIATLFPRDALSVRIKYKFPIQWQIFTLLPTRTKYVCAYYKITSTSEFQQFSGITYLITNLSHGTRYMVRVASINPAGLSDWSAIQEFQTFPIKPLVSKGATGLPSLVAAVVAISTITASRRLTAHPTMCLNIF